MTVAAYDGVISRIASIYALTDPDSGVVRYVGRTIGCPKQRLRRHLGDARRGARTWVARWLAKLDAEPGLLLLEECSPERSASAETLWIAFFRRAGIALTNLTDGGDGGRGLRHGPEARAKIGAAHRGKTVSAETRARQSLAHADPSAPHSRFRPRLTPDELSTARSERMKERWVNRREEMIAVTASARDSRHPQSEDARSARADAMRRRWQDPAERERLSASISAARRGGA